MDWREKLFADFAEDLEYHPRRGYLYLGLAVFSAMPWFLMPRGSGFTLVPLVFVLGGFGLFLKGIYLFRKSSEGIGLSFEEEVGMEEKAKQKRLPSFPREVAQIIQDFGMGVALLAPMLGVSRDLDSIFGNHPKLVVMLIGAIVLALGWFSKWLIRQNEPEAQY